jgi:hypothetical protein
MASTRLTNNHRDVLKALVTRIVDCPIEIKAEAAAYAKAAPMVRKIVEMKYPAAEMKVLDKYRCALLDECVRIQHPDGSVQQFTFRKGDAPNVPTTIAVASGCTSPMSASRRRSRPGSMLPRL